MFNELFWMAAADAAQGAGETTGSFGQTAVSFVILVGLVVFLLIRKKPIKKSKKATEIRTEQKQLETEFGTFSYHATALLHCGGLSLPDYAECNTYCNQDALVIVGGKQQFCIPTDRLLTVKLETETEVETETVVTTFYKYVENKPKTHKTITETYYLVISYIKKNGQVGYIYLNTPVDNREAAQFAKNCAPYCNGTVVKTEL